MCNAQHQHHSFGELCGHRKDKLAINVEFTVLEQKPRPGIIFSTRSTIRPILRGQTRLATSFGTATQKDYIGA